MTWEQIARDLFDILDDIDTADDIAKDDEKLYRELVRKHHARRFDYATTDGYSTGFFNVEAGGGIMGEVTKMFDGPIHEKKAHPETIKCLEDILQRAKSGEIVGVMVASMSYDRLGQWDVAGETYGFAIVGASEAGKIELLRRLDEIE